MTYYRVSVYPDWIVEISDPVPLYPDDTKPDGNPETPPYGSGDQLGDADGDDIPF